MCMQLNDYPWYSVYYRKAYIHKTACDKVCTMHLGGSQLLSTRAHTHAHMHTLSMHITVRLTYTIELGCHSICIQVRDSMKFKFKVYKYNWIN